MKRIFFINNNFFNFTKKNIFVRNEQSWAEMIFCVYPGLRLEFLAAAAAAAAVAAEPQPQVFYENFHFQNLSKKKSKSKEKLEKKKQKYFKTGI